jgi:peptide deformylase
LLANPKIKSYSQSKCFLSGGEGCLSVKKKHDGIVPRRSKVIVEAYDLINNKQIEIIAEDFLAINLQHEIDHLNGILYYDHINKSNPYFVDEE